MGSGCKRSVGQGGGKSGEIGKRGAKSTIG